MGLGLGLGLGPVPNLVAELEEGHVVGLIVEGHALHLHLEPLVHLLGRHRVRARGSVRVRVRARV